MIPADIKEMARQEAVVALVVLWVGVVDKDPGEAMPRAFTGLMYLAFYGYLFKRIKQLSELVRRIDAGEFSAY